MCLIEDFCSLGIFSVKNGEVYIEEVGAKTVYVVDIEDFINKYKDKYIIQNKKIVAIDKNNINNINMTSPSHYKYIFGYKVSKFKKFPLAYKEILYFEGE